MIQALVFDFDGLILETEEPVFQSWQELYSAHGCRLSFDDWATIIGTSDGEFDPLAALEAQVGYPLDLEVIAPQRRQREMELIASRTTLPGVQEYLEAARDLGLKVGIATSSSCDWVTGHLSRLGLLDYFDAIRSSDDVPLTKPDPALYLAAVEALQVQPWQALALEDSPNGILAAKRAGLWCVAVPNPLTSRLPLDKADLRLDSLTSMPLSELVAYFSKQLT